MYPQYSYLCSAVEKLRNPYFQKNLKISGFCVLQDVLLKVSEQRNTYIYLIIRTKENAYGNVVTDLTPVHVIPETLSYPLQKDLDENEIIYK